MAQRRAGIVVDARIFAGERTGARERLGWVDAKSVRVDEDGQSGGDRIASRVGWSIVTRCERAGTAARRRADGGGRDGGGGIFLENFRVEEE